MASEKIPLSYKGHPLRRKDNLIYYGTMAEKYIIMLQILSTQNVDGLEMANKVSVQLQLTDPDLKSRDRVVKKSEKDSLYAAMGRGLCLAGSGPEREMIPSLPCPSPALQKRNWRNSAMHLPKQLTAKLAAALIAVTTVIVPGFAANMGTVVTTDGLNVRSEANTDSSILTTLSYGTQVDVISTSGDGTWHQVSYNGITGYVSGDYLQVTEKKIYGQVTEGPLNIRSGPSTSDAVVGSLSTGSVVELQETLDGWYQIDEGYISSDYVAQVDASVAASSGTGSQIAQYALQYVGSPYVYGGSSPSGFDCSGFTTYVMKHFGYSVNRTASGQMDNGTAVDRSQLQPGDLVFFNSGNSSKRATHVGIYTGNGQFVHASTSTTGVIVSDLNSSYYSRTYVGARRL